ncbi:MAG: NUDIX domain-containing protein [Austwickia sp.]|jgi:8-oxo-dGTP pyrophosphatase MutT (NUDIX family)|nr:MAG: NUDIX domain-containing protein [Austwickia sp.]
MTAPTPTDGPAHRDAVRTLTAYAAADPHQARLRDEFLAHLAAHPDATRRSGPPAHLTVGVLVLDPAGVQVLLTHHRKADAWYQFGGHLEPTDATVRAAAARELAEESGLPGLELTALPVHLDRHALPGAFGRCREHLDVRYAAVAPAHAVPAVSPESHDVRWFPVDDLPPGAAADLGGLIAAARRALLGEGLTAPGARR